MLILNALFWMAASAAAVAALFYVLTYWTKWFLIVIGVAMWFAMGYLLSEAFRGPF